jgi:predicted aspartyl protease
VSLLVPALAAQEPAAPPSAAAATPPTTAPTSPEDVSEIIGFSEDDHSRMTVPVNISGNGPYAFLIDTGSERTVISRELARQLALGSGGEVRIHSMTETRDVATALIPHLQISSKSVKDIRAPAFSASNIGAAGMLGVDSLKSHRIVFDFATRTMSIVPSKKRPENWGPDVIIVTGRNLYGRLILTDARVNGEKIIAVVDTGSEVTIGNEALRRKLRTKGKLPETTPIELLSITGGRAVVDYTTVKQISLADIGINNMPVGFGDVHLFGKLGLADRPAILLGMDALRLFQRVSVDFARKEVRFLRADGEVSGRAEPLREAERERIGRLQAVGS